MNARAFGEPLEDENKIMIAESHLDETHFVNITSRLNKTVGSRLTMPFAVLLSILLNKNAIQIPHNNRTNK